MRGEPDDGPTLALLRAFRDRWMLATPQGRTLVAQYYVLAPGIVQAIPLDPPDWERIACAVDRAGTAVRAGDAHRAQAIYVDMVRTAALRWLVRTA